MKKKTFIALVAFIIAACHNQNSNLNDTEHSHEIEEFADAHEHESEESEHEEPKIQITSYSDDFEVFAEADPFVSGQESNVLSHFTNLSDFSALESGKVTLRLIINGEEISESLSKPARKGIYSFNIIPETSGEGQIIFDIETNSETYHIIAENITVYEDEEEAHKAAEKKEINSTNATVFTKEQSWKIDFATEPVIQEPFGEIIKTTAQIQSAQNDEMIIAAKTNGVVLLNNNSLLPGTPVSKEQTLFTISGSNFADNNSTVRYLEAQNNYEKAKQDFERIKSLADEKIVSEKELLEAKNTFENAELIYNNLNNNFTASGQSVKSSLSGFVKHLYIQNGEYVEAGQPVVVISRNKSLTLYAEVQPKYVNDLDFLKTAVIETANGQKSYTLEQLNGKIISWGKSANHDNFLVPVYLQIENNGDFIPGNFVTTYLKTESNKAASTIPNSALLEEQSLYFVYVQITPELFEKREIHTGSTDGKKTEVLSGLKSGERVVTKGAVFIKLSQASGALDPHAGHVH